ncbi:sugar-binding domain-containing protein [Brachybacterium sp. J144]|uniref:sugar-binding transcriptional regulator n=1 Tax=Brachybacterium sp. J144 TaxID=3116487 RepID=UPI002E78B7A8|nr:sugar-binding domain-containing protein [Brachybacterium sp. J144]MEE1650563.1 sugar-binding domain-containing protein [Brachybacterium sp. J144]
MLETHMDLQLLHRAASAYYLDDLRQAEVAEKLGVSRPTVSKLLTEARRIGMVRFEVLDIAGPDLADLETRLREHLGVERVRIAPGDQVQREFRGIGDLLAEELVRLDLTPGEVLLVSSGKTTHAVARMRGLPALPGVLVTPTIGGQQERDPAFQTNEIVRELASGTRAEPRFIFAPALPSPSLWRELQADPSFVEITDLWARARVVITGIGAPYLRRESLTSVVPREDPGLRSAVGDVCLYFFDVDGEQVPYPGSDRLVRPSLEVLRGIPERLALAAGREKAPSIVAGARTGMFSTLITDVPTAEAILAD